MIYLDNAATSFPKPREVIDAMCVFMSETCANPGRSGHSMAISAAMKVFEAREKVAQFFNVDDSRQVVFCQNITMALNTVMRGFLKKGDGVVTTSMEHNSVMRPLRRFESEKYIDLKVVKAGENGLLSPQDIAAQVDDNTRLAAINHGSNVNGTIQEIAAITKAVRAKNQNVGIVIDSAQTAGAIKLDFKELDIEFLAFTGHKSLMGPQGIGGLILKKSIDIDPLLFGGTGSDSEFEYQPEFLPDRLESGTQNNPGIIGLGAGIHFIEKEGIDTIIEKERSLTNRLVSGLQSIETCRIYREEAKDHLGVVSFNLKNIPCSTVGQVLNDEYGICIRTGLHCAPTAHRTLGTFPDGAARVSIGYFNTERDIDKLIDAVASIGKKR